jgi:DNA-binding NarL/FixJ family response regulator
MTVNPQHSWGFTGARPAASGLAGHGHGLVGFRCPAHSRDADSRRPVGDQARGERGVAEREHEVATRVGRGKSNAEIAGQLYMSEATVKAHISRALAKLNAANGVQLAIIVRDAGLD